MVGAALLNEHEPSYSLDNLGKKYCGRGKDDTIYVKLAEMFGGNATPAAQAPNFPRAPYDLMRKYTCQDTETTLALYQWQIRQVEEQGLSNVVDLEMRLLPCLVEMEQYGVRVDLDRAERAIVELSNIVSIKQEKLDRLAGTHINANPSKSIHDLLQPRYDESKKLWFLRDGTLCETTDAGKPSIDAECLRRSKLPESGLILDIRRKSKTIETFLRGSVLGNHHHGVIHANFNQTKSEGDYGTISGRLSCNNPNLQQIPKRDKETASIVRSVFLPDKGQDWGTIDWSQMDFRIFAHYLADPNILRAYSENPNLDFHQMVADLTGLPRKRTTDSGFKVSAKEINLGLCFGMSEGRMAYEAGLPCIKKEGKNGKDFYEAGEEAHEIFRNYHERVPGVRGLLDRIASVARSRGYIRTIGGRRSRFPGGDFAYKGGALLFQGSAADALKRKIIEVHAELRGTGSRLILNVHDELGLSLHDRSVMKRVKEIYECFDGISCPIKFNVPIRSSMGIGNNWWEASKED
jgi:DNA polymerase I-like protein with 3'-5' exonuclease and polymerase domains